MTKRFSVSRSTSPAPAAPSNSSFKLAERLGSQQFLREYEELVEYDIAENVVRLRRHRGLTQRALAERLGTRQPAIARIEAAAANPRLGTLRELAHALGARLRILFEPQEIAFPEYLPWWDCLDAGLAMPRDSMHITFVGTVQPTGAVGHTTDMLLTVNRPPELAEHSLLSFSSSPAVGLLPPADSGQHA